MQFPFPMQIVASFLYVLSPSELSLVPYVPSQHESTTGMGDGDKGKVVSQKWRNRSSEGNTQARRSAIITRLIERDRGRKNGEKRKRKKLRVREGKSEGRP